MFREFNIGKYVQRQTHRGYYCTCRHGDLHGDHWATGEGLCKHLIELINLLRIERKTGIPVEKIQEILESRGPAKFFKGININEWGKEDAKIN